MSFLYTTKEAEKALAFAKDFVEHESLAPFLLPKKAVLSTPGFASYILLLMSLVPHLAFLPFVLDSIYPIPAHILPFHVLFSACFLLLPFYLQVYGQNQWIHVWRYLSFLTTALSFGLLFATAFGPAAWTSLGAGVLAQSLLKLPNVNAFPLIQKLRREKNMRFMRAQVGKLKKKGK